MGLCLREVSSSKTVQEGQAQRTNPYKLVEIKPALQTPLGALIVIVVDGPSQWANQEEDSESRERTHGYLERIMRVHTVHVKVQFMTLYRIDVITKRIDAGNDNGNERFHMCQFSLLEH